MTKLDARKGIALHFEASALRPAGAPPRFSPSQPRHVSHHGVKHVVLFLGTNDLRRSATAAMVSEGIQNVVSRVKARGIKTYGATLVPRHNNQQIPWDAAKTQQRNLLNDWIRTKGPFDGVIDFDRVVRDEMDRDRLNPAYDCDGIHPSPLGYFEMGRAVRLDLFGRPGRSKATQ